ncbi:MAG: quinohemoprotein amine dehydrogenase subunit alpha [Acidobacteria bacterium]|nr:quinohemoprotein amine dehydrogenase subunit alpha [Acidobacteriota bacterium]
MMNRPRWLVAAFAGILAPIWIAGVISFAQAPAGSPAPGASQAPKAEEEGTGIPVTSDLVKQKCGSCHRSDDRGVMTRISYRRSTPEGWQETIRRMVTLNSVTLEPQEAREIVAYLANHHGLAPEEVRPAAWEVERRLIDFKYEADRDTENVCIKCHSLGRVLLQRRTRIEWELLIAMHRGYYPLVDTQAFRRGGPPQREPGPDGRPPDNRHPVDRVIDHVAKTFPLVTPEWSAWSATMRAPRLEGRWALSGYAPGQGPVFGEVVIASAAASPTTESSGDGAALPTSDPLRAEFTTTERYSFARSGKTVTRKGRAVVYTGFQWRGRSSEGSSAPTQPRTREDLVSPDMRQVMSIDRDWRSATGRWFTGAYDEIGIDVTLHRLGPDGKQITLLGSAQLLRAGGGAQTVNLYGANLPATVAPADLNFGPGISVTRVVSAEPDAVSVEVEVAQNAPVGVRDVFLSSANGRASVAVYAKIDGLKIKPQAGLARLGGANFPKQHQQFEAIAFSNGADGKPNTKDDIELGLVDAAWGLEEYSATFNDDDVKFVGRIDEVTGLFTPNVDGPNPQRSGNRNNVGDVWVVATYSPPGAAAGSKPLRSRAHLLVTVPLYLNWALSEVAPR